jgi:hypothetical protein
LLKIPVGIKFNKGITMNSSRWSVVQTWATIILAIAACITATISFISSKNYGNKIETAIQEMKSISGNMTQYFEYSARPALSIEMDEMRLVKRKWKWKWKYEVVIHLKNHGMLPANNIVVKFDPKIWSDSLKDWRKLDNPDKTSTSRTLFPGDIDSVKCKIRFSEEDLNVAKTHDNGIQLKSTVTYRSYDGSPICSSSVHVTYDRGHYKKDTTYVETKIW